MVKILGTRKRRLGPQFCVLTTTLRDRVAGSSGGPKRESPRPEFYLYGVVQLTDGIIRFMGESGVCTRFMRISWNLYLVL